MWTEIAIHRLRTYLCGALVALLAVQSLSTLKAQQESSGAEASASKSVKLTEEEKAFQELLNNCVLVGNFTVDGQPDSKKTERYEIRNVSKLDDGELWGMTSRIVYGDRDVTVPIPVPVKFAGSTPMISLDELFIPGLGTFSARVVFHGNRYAGTWQHGDKGGHMFGYIERLKDEPVEEKK